MFASLFRSRLEAPSPAVATVAGDVVGRVSRRTFVIGDPVMLGLLDWHAKGRVGELCFPDIDRAAAGCRGDVIRWEALEREMVAAAEERYPGFAKLVLEALFSPEDLARAYPDDWGGGHYRPFHREMLKRKWAGRPPGDRPLIVYHHVPKCAGMSMFLHLNDHFSWNDELVHLDGRARRDVLEAGCVPFDCKDERELERIEVLFGHDVSLAATRRLAGRELKFVTCLRDPASRMVSHYNWEMHQREFSDRPTPDFEEWYVGRERNWITCWLGRVFLGLPVERMPENELLARVTEELRKFWIVGTTDDFKRSMRPLTNTLGLPPVRRSANAAGKMYPNRFQLTPEWSERIAADNPADVNLVEPFIR